MERRLDISNFINRHTGPLRVELTNSRFDTSGHVKTQFTHVNRYMKLIEYLKPWRLATLAIGMPLLVAGSLFEQLADWDVGVSVLMALLTYLTAPYVCCENAHSSAQARRRCSDVTVISENAMHCIPGRARIRR